MNIISITTMQNSNEQIPSEISNEKLIHTINNWNDYLVVCVLSSYKELSKRKLQSPDLLSVLEDLKLENSLTEFCQANQFSKIEDFLASFAAFQEGKDVSHNFESSDEFGLCWA